MKISIGRLLVGLACLILTNARLPGQTAPTTPLSPLVMLEPLVDGEFALDGHWSDGTPLTARVVWSRGVGKKFVECKTFIADGDKEYQRYDNIFGVNNGQLTNYSFTFDGTTKIIPMTVEGNVLKSEWSDGAAHIRQQIDLNSAQEYRWQVWVTTDGKEAQIMDGIWKRRH